MLSDVWLSSTKKIGSIDEVSVYIVHGIEEMVFLCMNLGKEDGQL